MQVLTCATVLIGAVNVLSVTEHPVSLQPVDALWINGTLCSFRMWIGQTVSSILLLSDVSQ